MKRFISLITMLILLVGAALPALAETAPAPIQLTKAYEVPLGELLGSSNLVGFRAKGFAPTGIMAPDGTLLVPDEYLWLGLDNPWGYIAAAKLDQLNGKGVIDQTGKVLVPFEYGEIEVLNKDWVVGIRLKESTGDNFDYQALFGGYGSGYYLIEDRTFYNMKTGQAAGTLTREQYDNVRVYDGFLVVKDLKDAITVYDEALRPLGTAEQTYHGYTFTKNGDQWEVRRAGDGELVLTTPYMVNSYKYEDGTFDITGSDNKRGRMDFEGNVVIPTEYENLYTFDGDYIRAKRERDGKMGLLDRQGNVAVDFKYDDFIATYARGEGVGQKTFLFVKGYVPVELDGKIGFVNDKGEETVAPTYMKAAVELAANSLLITTVDGKFTVVAADGTVTELPYAKVQRLYNAIDGRLYQATNDEGKVGVVDWHGNLVVPFGPYSDYGNTTSTFGDLLLMDNRETRMVEVYRVEQP